MNIHVSPQIKPYQFLCCPVCPPLPLPLDVTSILNFDFHSLGFLYSFTIYIHISFLQVFYFI